MGDNWGGECLFFPLWKREGKKSCYLKQMLSQGRQRTRTMSLESTQGRAWSPERLMPCVSSCLLLSSKGRRLFSCGSAQVSNEGSQGCWIEVSYWGSFVSGETKLLYHKSKCQSLENKSGRLWIKSYRNAEPSCCSSPLSFCLLCRLHNLQS